MNEEYKTVKVIVDDMSVKLETKATMIPKCIVEQILNEVLKETKDTIPKSKVDKGLRGYIDFLEYSRKLWKSIAILTNVLYLVIGILKLVIK